MVEIAPLRSVIHLSLSVEARTNGARIRLAVLLAQCHIGRAAVGIIQTITGELCIGSRFAGRSRRSGTTDPTAFHALVPVLDPILAPGLFTPAVVLDLGAITPLILTACSSRGWGRGSATHPTALHALLPVELPILGAPRRIAPTVRQDLRAIAAGILAGGVVEVQLSCRRVVDRSGGVPAGVAADGEDSDDDERGTEYSEDELGGAILGGGGVFYLKLGDGAVV
jgi:hypothetical protein